MEVMEKKESQAQLVVVIPCHDEPDLLNTLDSLWLCRSPPCRVEVVVVINGASNDAPEVKTRNRLTLESAQAWIAERLDVCLRPPMPLVFHLLFESELPPRQAGVGTARKIGMDWALTRFSVAQRDSGVIVCLDADCTVATNYLEALHEHFQTYPRTPGCSIHFEHPLADLACQQRQGIVYYELFLRYYLHALRWSGFPHAFHSVGSSMAVRAGPYRRQGGMNRRKAGEDFYFLQKIIPLGNFSELRHTSVFPSARASLRVPFGTGRMIAGWLAGDKNPGLVYHPQVFHALSLLFMRVEQLHAGSGQNCLADQHTSMQNFLEERQFTTHLAEIRRHTSSPQTFRKRFFHWFNAFQVLKYVHFATEHTWPKIPVWQAGSTVLHWMGMMAKIEMESEVLLEHYRRLDRDGCWHIGWQAMNKSV